MTVLIYDTAWQPNNALLERLHKVTGWYILNTYEEPGVGFEGFFFCQNNSCRDYRYIYHPDCEICGKRQHPNFVDYDDDDRLGCRHCLLGKPQ